MTGDSARDPLDGSTSGSTMGDPIGSAEVRSGLHSGRGSGDEYSGLGFAPEATTTGGVRERVAGTARSVAETVRERAGTLAGTVRESAGDLGHRAGEAATQARERISHLSERTNRALEERGFLARLQENPLPALGLAFGIGFLLAGGRRGGRPDTPGNRARQELRAALMAGLTAGAAQATRGFLQSAGGPDGILGSLAGSRGGTRPPSHRENV